MRLVCASCHDTMRLGRRLSGHLLAGDIVLVSGELGSGKTVFTKGIAEGLGLDKHDILSPTFVIIREYEQARLPFYHFDLYRLNSPGDIEALGYEEYFFGQGVSVVEWPERLKFLLPAEYLSVQIRIISQNGRQVSFRAFGRRYKRLLDSIR